MGALNDPSSTGQIAEEASGTSQSGVDTKNALVSIAENKASRRRGTLIVLGSVVVLALISAVPLIRWQRAESLRAESLNMMRRVGIGFQMYAQDWDSCPPPLAVRLPGNAWRTWPEILRPYVAPLSAFRNPSNPVAFEDSGLRDPDTGVTIRTGYALNARFWNTFAPGPFPVDNLELSPQTVLLVEAGPLSSANGRETVSAPPPFARQLYSDTLERVSGLCPYPSLHNGKMNAIAADGHGVLLRVEHYRPEDGPHDPLYGRLGGNVYNWNGGHPNGQTDTPARD